MPIIVDFKFCLLGPLQHMAELGGLNDRNEEVKEVRIQIVRKVISTGVEPTKSNFSIGGEGDSDPGGKIWRKLRVK